MLHLLHWLLIFAYLASPLVAVFFATQWRQGRTLGLLTVAVIVGTIMGAGFTFLHAREVDGRATFIDFSLASYFGTALVLMAKWIDMLLRRVLRTRPRSTLDLLPAMMGLVRGLVLIVLGLPFVMSVLLVYRPKAIPRTNPMSQLQFPFTPVTFRSTDGVKLSGWWIPALQQSPRRRGSRPSEERTRTVILCHEWGGNKATQLVLVRQLVPAGYNALSFDFRGHGESGGQLSTLGNLERRDVLGAVAWLKQMHPDESQRIVGVGAGMGGDALIAAAADHGELGQAIEAVAVYGAYDDLESLTTSLARSSFSPPMDWMAAKLGLSLASVHVGVNLLDFKPTQLVYDLWPRPIFVIHAMLDDQIPFENGERLFKAASFPKQPLWLQHEDQDDAINDDAAAAAVRRFFDNAKPMPVI